MSLDGAHVKYSPQDLALALGSHMPTAQQAAVIASPLQPALVIAGAGSGKTATMADRVVWLLANGLVQPEEILGLTFTRKAASELQARISSHIVKLRAAGLLSENGDHLPLDPEISTYHSYANRIVSDYGIRLGIESEAPLIGAAQTYQIASRIVDEYNGESAHLTLARSTLISAVLTFASQCAEHLVTPLQAKSYLEEFLAPLLLLPQVHGKETEASGEAQRLLGKLQTRITVAELAAEFDRRKRELGVLDYGDLVSFAVQLAQRSPLVRRGENERFKVVLLDEFQDTSWAQLSLFRALFSAYDASDGAPGPEADSRGALAPDAAPEAGAVKRGAQDASSAVMAVGDPNQSIYGFRGASAGQLFAFAHAFPLVSAEGFANAPTYFLSTAWRNSLSVLSAANRISAPLRAKDSAAEAVQNEAVQNLGVATAQNAATTPPTSRTPHQATISETVTISDTATASDTVPTSDMMPTSGSPRISDTATSLDSAGAVRVPQLDPRPAAPEGSVQVHWFASEEEEIEALTQDLEVRRVGESAPASSAILCRKRTQMEPLARALEERGIPYEIVGLAGLMNQPEIIDLIATLHLLVDPGRADALMRILTGARWRIGPADLMALADWARELGSVDRHVDEKNKVEHTIVDAIDTLPPSEWTSAAGRQLSGEARERLVRLSREIIWLRTRLGQNLVQIISDIERTILLDIELMAKPRGGLRNPRVHLDAFIEHVMSFTRSSEQAGPAALLAWLADAQVQENGLAIAQEDLDPDAVQIMTVHASKGLEWDNVYVPGMVEGSFPTDKVSRWSQDDGALPWPLRGDSADLPWWDTDQLDLRSLVKSEKLLKEDAQQYGREEERRLAYVALTRARDFLWCSGAATRKGARKVSSPSEFLEDVKELVNPELEWLLPEPPDAAEETLTLATWPYDPLEGPFFVGTDEPLHPLAGRRHALEAFTRLVESELVTAAPSSTEVESVEGPSDEGPSGEFTPHAPDSPTQPSLTSSGPLLDLDMRSELGRSWSYEAQKLLALRLAQQTEHRHLNLSHLPASALVSLAQNPEAIRLQLRRPVPLRPSEAARAGVEFHAWIENYFAQAGALELGADLEAFDIDEGLEGNLQEWKETFLASPWADRVPTAVEFPLETQVAGLPVRGRIDAVFQNPDGTWDLVDWKSGRVPPPEELSTKALQLSLYRLAWAQLQQIPPEQVKTAFYYVASGQTLRPETLSTEEEIREIITSGLGLGTVVES